MLDKEQQYDALYFPLSVLALKQQVYFELLDIDANYSKIIRELLPSLLEAIAQIKKENNNYRHYHWSVKIELKGSKSGKTGK